MRISSELFFLAGVNSIVGCDWTILPSNSHVAQSRSKINVFPLMICVSLSLLRIFPYTLWWVLICLCVFFSVPRVAGAGFCQEPITVLEGPWSAESSLAFSTWSAPLCTCSSSTRTALQVSSSLSVLGFVVHLVPPCLHLALVPWRLMDCQVLYVVMD